MNKNLPVEIWLRIDLLRRRNFFNERVVFFKMFLMNKIRWKYSKKGYYYRCVRTCEVSTLVYHHVNRSGAHRGEGTRIIMKLVLYIGEFGVVYQNFLKIYSSSESLMGEMRYF